MTELNVVLNFACWDCEGNVGVTLRCEGEGLLPGARVVATVNVPCPNCGKINRLVFEPSGAVRAVEPYEAPLRQLAPSVN